MIFIRCLTVAFGLYASVFTVSAVTQPALVEPTTIHPILGPDTSALYYDNCPPVRSALVYFTVVKKAS